jgi:hypothetical protein
MPGFKPALPTASVGVKVGHGSSLGTFYASLTGGSPRRDKPPATYVSSDMLDILVGHGYYWSCPVYSPDISYCYRLVIILSSPCYW